MDLPVLLERSSTQPLQSQLTEQMRRAILDGRLAAGTRLPSTRVLSKEIGVSRNVALAAYDELFADAYVEGRHGSGTLVSGDLPPLPRPSLPVPLGSPRWLRPITPLPDLEVDVPGAIEFRLGKP
ncbi:MAG TPA: winged helix-turn-helix domain-containing protein [Thermomicrobiales bacterium]|nr:winged helix-turn-helix domain-containing protein [Thermomicrobiales bacterium]